MYSSILIKYRAYLKNIQPKINNKNNVLQGYEIMFFLYSVMLATLAGSTVVGTYAGTIDLLSILVGV